MVHVSRRSIMMRDTNMSRASYGILSVISTNQDLALVSLPTSHASRRMFTVGSMVKRKAVDPSLTEPQEDAAPLKEPLETNTSRKAHYPQRFSDAEIAWRTISHWLAGRRTGLPANG